MKNIVKRIVLASVLLTAVACGTQKNTSNNNERGGPPNSSQLLAEMDANKYGKLAKSEVKGPLQNDFAKIDSNHDGFITKAELDKAPKPQRGQGPRQN
ncbi:EF-hand domain-containing protein [Portibacter lacus]|uniref:EF-hand domain-containing protein n=1 Tax=Portibacter lacus TaxID=1099794 RepID=A0AA37WEU4_9BACT|nr:EF-hand domain-containing protein [Portibacter lacus]GLR18268.1 hypothetical protein GCM10007940_28840 [Portibacter lacus]